MAREVSSAERWFRRIIKIVLLGVVIAVGISFWPEEIVQVRTEAVGKGPVEQIVPSLQAGEVKPNRKALLRAVTAGRATALNVKRGDRVAY
jgi:multidrug efflux pump subunit AcrA (membrane-fusion protein)